MRIVTNLTAAFLILAFTLTSAQAAVPQDVFRNWYKLALELVRHTATYTPPVASRSFAYLSIAAFEATASGPGTLKSLSGQIQGLPIAPQRAAGKAYDEAVVMQAAMATMVESLFSNTGPTGHHAITAFENKMARDVKQNVPENVVKRSEIFGRHLAESILKWSMDDGGAVIQNMGFSSDYVLTKGPGHWVPTNTVDLQQKPLLPNWGKNRSFAMPNGATCKLPAPPEYSEDKNSEFYKQAMKW